MGIRTLTGRTLARAQALQLLFQAEACGRKLSDVLEDSYALESGPLDEYGEVLALGVEGLQNEIDALLDTRSQGWSVSRMPAVDRNILRIAIYEMLCIDEVDIAISIDESVELAKRYGTDDSSKFVNGVLGRIADDIEAGVDILAQVKR